jgi:PAS domain S-box-containing protein
VVIFAQQIEFSQSDRMNSIPEQLIPIISALPIPVAVLDTALNYIVTPTSWCKRYGLQDVSGRPFLETLQVNDSGDELNFRAFVAALSLEPIEHTVSRENFVHKLGNWELSAWFNLDETLGGWLIYEAQLVSNQVHANSGTNTNKGTLEIDVPASSIFSNTRTSETELQFKQAFDQTLIGMALISPAGMWEKVNKSLTNMIGYTEEELLNMNISDVTHPDDLERSQSALKDLVAGEIDSIKIEKRYLHKNGSTIWVNIATSMLKTSAGTPLHYVAQIEDVTKRKEIEEDLLLSEKKYRTIFENVQDVFYQTNPQGIVTDISPSIKLYSGYSREEVIGRPASDFYYYLQDRKRILDNLQTKGSVTDFEVRLKTSNNKLKYASVNARLIIENGVLVSTEGSMRDVTTRKFQENALKALNTQLTASNDQKNKLLSIIGHDLRNPIAGSLQLLDLTLMDYESTTATELHTYLFKMKSELSNANELLEDLLSWAKAQFNAVSFNPTEVPDVSVLIDKSVQNVLPMAINKGVEINRFYQDGLRLKVDQGMLETIIRNLVSNAVKFSVKGGQIDVRVDSYEKGVRFSVADNGIGIPKDMIPKLFDKHTNYTTFGTLGEKGTGLGLNLCYDFVQRHGGKLWVESEPKIGSTFYFTIPQS